ncbi:MAG: hypothetical protein KF760_13750 [Candidatus Eremiobacteraeota bacterium]|nr:hypothetical protein [Candidatus Eremiobacteraeota bacterium]MCW5870655.1 hypothetical protein [Candidatus Eremiobacteraeota bacterium]
MTNANLPSLHGLPLRHSYRDSSGLEVSEYRKGLAGGWTRLRPEGCQSAVDLREPDLVEFEGFKRDAVQLTLPGKPAVSLPITRGPNGSSVTFDDENGRTLRILLEPGGYSGPKLQTLVPFKESYFGIKELAGEMRELPQKIWQTQSVPPDPVPQYLRFP